ncbi:MAG: hypothetical protein HOB17_12400 [Candidatus Marinimicrobia bacterium]|jgi:hypothetical protein|nr:hypothetical protein [Bacteroidota bacterium]MBT3934808.1 hypothetical protein [Bacteroidota bacterium]MBT6714709.1 hypothetical protein [Candidatus Neomarinimicrobiota bacterium]MBT7825335.1 hypothetical protein [Bacteroidota bacterium]
MKWFKVSIEPEDVARGVHIRIQEDFNKVFMALHAPKEMALFSNTLLGNKTLDLYFSPGSYPFVKIINNKYNGTEIEELPPKDVVLLVGHADAKNDLVKWE